MSGQHTPGPWEYIDATKEAQYRYASQCVIRGDGKQIASFSWGDSKYWPTKEESQANARRIVASVNACAGTATEALEELIPLGGVHALTVLVRQQIGDLEDSKQQRDQLAAALRDLLEHAEWSTLPGEAAFDRARALLVSVGGPS